MRRFGLIGFPLTQSFSRNYFTKKFEAEKIQDCRYDLFPLESIYEIDELVKNHPGLEGLNVTIPYKQLVLDLLHDRSRLPHGLEACNCISIQNGKLIGYNTDVIGFENTLKPLLKDEHQQALVLGTGGAAKAVIYVLKKLGIPFSIVSRTPVEHGSYLYSQLNTEIVRNHKVIINCTPLGMYPHVDTAPPIPYNGIGSQHLLYDLVYNPPETMFLLYGKERGAVAKNGWEMLRLQAEASWEIWNS